MFELPSILFLSILLKTSYGFLMKKIVEDPTNVFYNLSALTDLFTEFSDFNKDDIPLAEKDVQEYIKDLTAQGSNYELKAIGISMRFETDSEFRKQMLEASLQHQAIIESIFYDDDSFFDNYLFPKIKALAKFDFGDTKEFRLYKLIHFSFEEFEKQTAMTLSDFYLKKGKERINMLIQYFWEQEDNDE